MAKNGEAQGDQKNEETQKSSSRFFYINGPYNTLTNGTSEILDFHLL